MRASTFRTATTRARNHGHQEHLLQGHGQQEHLLIGHGARIHLKHDRIACDSLPHGHGAATTSGKYSHGERVHLVENKARAAAPCMASRATTSRAVIALLRVPSAWPGRDVREKPLARPPPRVSGVERSWRYLPHRLVLANDAPTAPIFAPEEPVTVAVAVNDNERVQAAPGDAMPPHFAADEDRKEHDTSSRHLVALLFESATASPEVVSRSADA